MPIFGCGRVEALDPFAQNGLTDLGPAPSPGGAGRREDDDGVAAMRWWNTSHSIKTWSCCNRGTPCSGNPDAIVAPEGGLGRHIAGLAQGEATGPRRRPKGRRRGLWPYWYL
jgi:hypothetical protein